MWKTCRVTSIPKKNEIGQQMALYCAYISFPKSFLHLYIYIYIYIGANKQFDNKQFISIQTYRQFYAYIACFIWRHIRHMICMLYHF